MDQGVIFPPIELEILDDYLLRRVVVEQWLPFVNGGGYEECIGAFLDVFPFHLFSPSFRIYVSGQGVPKHLETS